MTDKQIIIEDCPYFIGGCCQEYLDGVCKNHKCDLKIIRELEQKLKAKEQECEELKEKLKEMNEVIRTETTRCSLVYFLQTDLDQLKAENKHLNDLLNQALKELEKTRETLTEIKEIAENGKRFAERYMITGEQKANVLTYANAILQKISECEVNNGL